jgi:hypothetical protein
MFEVESPEKLSTGEVVGARAYWSDVEIEFYKQPKPWSDTIATRILEFNPRSVFEFGCNAGKNLQRIQLLAPDVVVRGGIWCKLYFDC